MEYNPDIIYDFDVISDDIIENMVKQMNFIDLMNFINKYSNSNAINRIYNSVHTLNVGVMQNYVKRFYITNIRKFKNLHTLICDNLFEYFNKVEVNEIFNELINLTSLDCSISGYIYEINHKEKITNEIISKLINLKELICNGCLEITDESISKMVNLTKLSCNDCKYITDISISKLINLIYFSCRNCNGITDESIIKLTKLKYLTIGCTEIDQINDRMIIYEQNSTYKGVVKIKQPRIRKYYVTDKSISKLTELIKFSCYGNIYITNESIIKMTKLENLYCTHCEQITVNGIIELTNLKYLDWDNDDMYKIHSIKPSIICVKIP